MPLSPEVTNLSGTYTQNPVLVPNMSSGLEVAQAGASGNLGVSLIQLEQKAAFLRLAGTPAHGAFTITGTVVAGDTFSCAFTSELFPEGYTLVATVEGTTVTLAAAAIVAQMAVDATMQSIGAYGTNAAGVLTIHIPGFEGNGASIVITASGSENINGANPNTAVVLSGGTGAVTPLESFNFLYNGQIQSFIANRPRIIDAQFYAALVAANMPVS